MLLLACNIMVLVIGCEWESGCQSLTYYFPFPYLLLFFSFSLAPSLSLSCSLSASLFLIPSLSLFHPLPISLSLQLTGLFQFTVRLLSETEARFTSVERINHYIKVRAARLKALLSTKLPVGRVDGEANSIGLEYTLRHHGETQASLIDPPSIQTAAELSVSWWVGGHACVCTCMHVGFISPARKQIENWWLAIWACCQTTRLSKPCVTACYQVTL